MLCSFAPNFRGVRAFAIHDRAYFDAGRAVRAFMKYPLGGDMPRGAFMATRITTRERARLLCNTFQDTRIKLLIWNGIFM